MNKNAQSFFSSMGMDNLSPWQKQMLEKLRTVDKPFLIQNFRSSGKSQLDAYNRLYADIFQEEKLICDGGTVYGKQYYTVKPIGVSALKWGQMNAWMIDCFGQTGTDDLPGAWAPDQRWYANNGRFWFQDEADRTLFLLKWS
jgi:hypothetical protein